MSELSGIVFEPIFVFRPFEGVHAPAQAIAHLAEALDALQHDVDLARALIVELDALERNVERFLIWFPTF